jgi:hypothetical protein
MGDLSADISGYSRERLDATKAFMADLFDLRPVGRPGYSLSGFVPEERVDRVGKPGVASRRAVFADFELNLREQIDRDKAHSQLNDDSVPALFPYLGTGVFASAFGCELVYPEDEHPWTKPVVRSPDDVSRLPEPDPHGGLLPRILEMTRYFSERTNEQYPIRITDIQSPADTASLLWQYDDFLASMLTHPDEVHQVLEAVTELMIEFVPMQRELVKEWVPNHCPQVWVPEDFGVSISDDLAAVLSPSQYEEFALPYNQRVAKAFGGIHVHSCGDYSHVLPHIRATQPLRSIDFGATEMPMAAPVRELGGECVLIPRLGLNKEIHFGSTLDYLNHVLDVGGDAPMFIFIEHGADKLDGFVANGLAEVESALKARGVGRQ